MVILHYTGMETAAAAITRLCDPAAEVSAHYVVTERGETLRLVAEAERAWHAGAGAWGGVTDVNSHSIGIEIVNRGGDPFPDPQMKAVIALVAAVAARHAIPPERILAHSDVAPGRKSDPGPKFDWRRLAAAGLAVWSDAPPAPGDWRALAHRIGYRGAGVLETLQHRFAPEETGRPPSDRLTGRLADIARRHPVKD